jgi:DNA-binding beta-propeller fold protein YncE
MKFPRITWLALLALSLATGALAAGAPHFTVARTILLAGEGGWDYLTMDSQSHRLFVSHATHVQVLNTKNDSLVGDIPDTPGIHGVALAPELGRGFTSNGRDSSVTVFDYTTLSVITRIKLDARNPDAICYDPVSRRVFTFNGGSGNSSAIEAASATVAGSVPLDGKPEFAVADGKGTIFVNIEDSSAVVAFDSRTLHIQHRWPIAPGEEPSGLAMDRKHRRLFSGCSNEKLIVLDADKGTVVASLPIGKGVDAVAFDPNRNLIFSSNGEGTLTVIHEDSPDKYSVLENAPTQRGARTMALDETTGTAYSVTADFGPTPAPTEDRPHPRPPIQPGTFRVLVMKGK